MDCLILNNKQQPEIVIPNPTITIIFKIHCNIPVRRSRYSLKFQIKRPTDSNFQAYNNMLIYLVSNSTILLMRLLSLASSSSMNCFAVSMYVYKVAS